VQKKVVLSSDSPGELPESLQRELDIRYMPIWVNMRGQSLRDGVELSPMDVFDFFYNEKEVAGTSAGSLGDYEEHFAKASEDGKNAVLHFALGGAISSSYNNAVIAAQTFGDVYVVDSQSLSVGMALQLLRAHRLRGEGLEAAAIAAEAERYKKRVRAAGLIGSLDFIRKSGRVTAVEALGANLLGIQPAMHFVDGRAVIYKKLRGRAAAVQAQWIDDLLDSPEGIDGTAAFVYHTNMPEAEYSAAVERVRKSGIFRVVYTGRAGAVTGTHLGDKALMLGFAGR